MRLNRRHTPFWQSLTVKELELWCSYSAFPTENLPVRRQHWPSSCNPVPPEEATLGQRLSALIPTQALIHKVELACVPLRTSARQLIFSESELGCWCSTASKRRPGREQPREWFEPLFPPGAWWGTSRRPGGNRSCTTHSATTFPKEKTTAVCIWSN